MIFGGEFHIGRGLPVFAESLSSSSLLCAGLSLICASPFSRGDCSGEYVYPLSPGDVTSGLATGETVDDVVDDVYDDSRGSGLGYV